MFQVLQQADDLNILTLDELRVAVGIEYDDDSQDVLLEPLGLRVSARIASACLVVIDGAIPATLRLERVRDTFRFGTTQAGLYLSRRPVVLIASLTEDGETLTQDVDFELNATSGKLTRLNDDAESTWSSSKVVVEYDAGYETVPDALKAVASELVGTYWADRGTDPMEKSFSIPGVIATERWVDSGADSQMPADLMTALLDGGYVNRFMIG